MSYRLEVFDIKSNKSIVVLENVTGKENILAIKKRVAQKKSSLPVDRQSIRLEAKGKNLGNEDTLETLGLSAQNAQLYVKDLGPQISWKTVFILEYAGPLFLYPIFYARPSILYGKDSSSTPVTTAVYLALICWSIHYAKRIFETLFIHRFSNATMPLFNLFKNCGYYWGFAAFIAYFVNHPKYSAPLFGIPQVYLGLAIFCVAEFGNLSIHILQRNLRPAGTRERKIPKPDGNPMSLLFNYVSCPNYTYEVMSWVGFTIMTQSFPAAMFTAAGFFQMALWAQGKHKNYKKEFSDYPKSRTAIVPFIL